MSAETGVLEGTRGRILEELAVTPRTARDLADKLGIQESAARGHLERLEERGLVVPTFHREGVGRPRKRYALTPTGQELFPKQYGMILNTIVDELLSREGEGFVGAVFAQAGERMARAIASDLPASSSMEERAQHLVAALNRIGFGCSAERTPEGRYRIVRTNCVFRQSALAHSYLLCEVFDKHLTETLLGGAGVDLEESIGRGGVRCAHLIPLR